MKKLILISLTFIGCNECEYVPTIMDDGGYIIDAHGRIMCHCECTYNDWEPCNDLDTPRHKDCPIWW